MSKQRYIVPNDLLQSSPPRGEWDAHTIPADPSRSVLTIEWDNHNDWAAFDQLAEVQIVGEDWETISPDVAALLASFSGDAPLTSSPATSAMAPVSEAPITPDSVSAALKKTGWLGFRSR
jgi:hypothetical protein